MTARRVHKLARVEETLQQPKTAGRRPSRDPVMPRAVVSVSPDVAESIPLPMGPDSSSDAATAESGATVSEQRESIFLTPRVIDQNAYNELASTLKTLVSRAETYSTALAETLSQATTDETQLAEASAQLEERLKLGARMLKAFQSQIGAVESTLESLNTHHDSVNDSVVKIHDVESRLAQTIESFDAHIRESIANAEKIVANMADKADDTIVDTAAAQLAQLEPYKLVENRLSESMERAEALCRDIESAEVNAAALMRRHGDVSVTAQHALERLEDLLSTSTHQLDEQAEAINEHIGTHLTDMRSAEQSIVERIAQAEAVQADVHAACTTTEGRLQEMIDLTEDKLVTASEQIQVYVDALMTQARDEIAAAVQGAVAEVRASCEVIPVEVIESPEAFMAAATTAASPTTAATTNEIPVPSGEADEVKAMPEFINRMLEDLRRGIGEDMARLTSEVSIVADRVASLRPTSEQPGVEEIAIADEATGDEKTDPTDDTDGNPPGWYQRHMEGA